MAEPIARVHVDNFDPEVYTGEEALITANLMADVYRSDFPGAVVGVSYNPEAAESAKRLRLEAMGFTEEAPEEAVYSSADQFSQFPIGQIFYPEAGELAYYRFVKTGEDTVVRINQDTGETDYVTDVFGVGQYSHWKHWPAGLITYEEAE